MDALLIQEKIQLYKIRIRDYEEENVRLRNKISNLDTASSEYRKRQLALDNYRNRKREVAYQVRMVSQVRIAESYADSLLNLSDNYQSYAAADSFVGIQSELSRIKRKYEDEILTNNRTIKALYEEIAYWKNRLYSMS